MCSLIIDEDFCGDCHQSSNNEMIACDNCNSWIHYHCVPLLQSQVDRVHKFYCSKCKEDNSKLINVWKKKKANHEKREEKDQFYWEVERILSHFTKRVGSNVSRRFRIKWK